MATLTLRNVPDNVYESLKAEAKRNRRSLNQEAIARLQAVVGLRPPEDARLAFQRAREFRRTLGLVVDHNEVKKLIEEGRA